MPAARRTGKESSASTAVVNQAQQVSGIRIRDMPFVRRFSSVVMKLSAPRSEATQKSAMLVTQRLRPAPCPGTFNRWPMALKGAYPVHPPVGPMTVLPEAKMAVHSATRPRKVTQNESMLRTGKAMSSAPIWRGRK